MDCNVGDVFLHVSVIHSSGFEVDAVLGRRVSFEAATDPARGKLRAVSIGGVLPEHEEVAA